LARPVVMAITRKPSVLFIEIGAGLAIMATGVLVHLITLPVEFDASFSPRAANSEARGVPEKK